MNDLDFIWVLDASSAGVFKVELPSNFPENGDYEKFLDSSLYQRHGWESHGNQIG